MALVFSIYSIILAIISVAFVHSYCIMCMVSYAVNLMLVFFTWLTHKRFENRSIANGIYKDIQWIRDHKKGSGLFLGAAAGLMALLICCTPRYWEMQVSPLGRELSRGTTEEGHPWIGADNPRLEITEFTDYQCFQCKKMHFYLREFMTRHPDTIRLIHRNFPMDHKYNPMVKEPYHIGAGKMALLSLYAINHGKFWEISDFLFNIDTQNGHFNIKEMAGIAGFDVLDFANSINDRTLQQKLRADILEAIRLGINATPGYLIDGKIYVGHVPADIINLLRE
jgi:predicted DsbA family dithiol-disulfide isomerase